MDEVTRDFIQYINETYLNNDQMDALLELYQHVHLELNPPRAIEESLPLPESPPPVEKVSSTAGCVSKMKTGAKAGQPCGKPCQGGTTFCGTHRPKAGTTASEEVPNAGCTATMASGAKKGQTCQKPCLPGQTKCAQHGKTVVEQKPLPRCPAYWKTGPNEGSLCGVPVVFGKTTCAIHDAIRVRRQGDYFIVKNTSVLFDIVQQAVIGYWGDRPIFQENEETKAFSHQFDIPFLATM